MRNWPAIREQKQRTQTTPVSRFDSGSSNARSLPRSFGKSGVSGGDGLAVAAEALNNQARCDQENSGTNQVGKRSHNRQETGGEDRAEDAREATGALCDTDGGALLVARGEVGEESKQGGAGESGADREQTEGSQHG